MSLSPFADETHGRLQTALRELLSPTGSPSIVVADVIPQDPRRGWKALAGFGVFALAVPAEHGGLGLSVVESALTFEELGRALAWGPLIWTQLAALAVPGLASGERIVTGVDLAGLPEGDPIIVEHLAAADRVLVLSADGVLLCDAEGLDRTELARPLDPATPVARLDRPPRGERVADADTAVRLRRAGRLLSAAYLLGISDTALQISVEYAKQRRQFDRPIGGFQAIKHLLADCHVRTGLARAALYAAAELETVEASADDGGDLSAAKLLCGRAADTNARTAVQVFGGMGFTWETAPHLLLKRAWVLDGAFGTGAEHALALGAELAGTRTGGTAGAAGTAGTAGASGRAGAVA